MGLVSCAMKATGLNANISQSSCFIRIPQAPAMRLPDMSHKPLDDHAEAVEVNSVRLYRAVASFLATPTFTLVLPQFGTVFIGNIGWLKRMLGKRTATPPTLELRRPKDSTCAQ
jgi:hypothetical protein